MVRLAGANTTGSLLVAPPIFKLISNSLLDFAYVGYTTFDWHSKCYLRSFTFIRHLSSGMTDHCQHAVTLALNLDALQLNSTCCRCLQDIAVSACCQPMLEA
eukprot:GHRR01033790.1.p2 GENE.GHRR01033790.1~~GHRR01033790.1.p2  ORF type:complete len:102 (-),score=17.24 GHRR01033790.1:393-698(-)